VPGARKARQVINGRLAAQYQKQFEKVADGSAAEVQIHTLPTRPAWLPIGAI
jgi:hypothetical protein